MGALIDRFLTPVLGLALAAALFFAFWQNQRLASVRLLYAQEQKDFAEYRDKQARDHAAAIEKLRADESHARSELQKGLDDANAKTKAAQDAVLAGAVERDRLRKHAQALAAASRCKPGDSSTPASGQTADSPGDLLAELFGRADDAAEELARYADQARIAGQLCERAHDALRSEAP